MAVLNRSRYAANTATSSAVQSAIIVIGILIWRLVPATPTMATGGFDYIGALGLGVEQRVVVGAVELGLDELAQQAQAVGQYAEHMGRAA